MPNAVCQKTSLIQKVYIQVGSVCERKNQLGALELLLSFLKKDSNSILLYTCGIITEDYQQEIKNLAEKNGIGNQVWYLGEMKTGKELNQYYSIAEAMVFPAKSEGFSLVILEAMMAGTPVLIRDTLEYVISRSSASVRM